MYFSISVFILYCKQPWVVPSVRERWGINKEMQWVKQQPELIVDAVRNMSCSFY